MCSRDRLCIDLHICSSLLMSATVWYRVTPGREFYYDGITLNPFEVMFVPMDTIAVENGWTFAKLASVYASWLGLQVGTNWLAWMAVHLSLATTRWQRVSSVLHSHAIE